MKHLLFFLIVLYAITLVIAVIKLRENRPHEIYSTNLKFVNSAIIFFGFTSVTLAFKITVFSIGLSYWLPLFLSVLCVFTLHLYAIANSLHYPSYLAMIFSCICTLLTPAFINILITYLLPILADLENLTIINTDLSESLFQSVALLLGSYMGDFMGLTLSSYKVPFEFSDTFNTLGGEPSNSGGQPSGSGPQDGSGSGGRRSSSSSSTGSSPGPNSISNNGNGRRTREGWLPGQPAVWFQLPGDHTVRTNPVLDSNSTNHISPAADSSNQLPLASSSSTQDSTAVSRNSQLNTILGGRTPAEFADMIEGAAQQFLASSNRNIVSLADLRILRSTSLHEALRIIYADSTMGFGFAVKEYGAKDVIVYSRPGCGGVQNRVINEIRNYR